MVLFEGLSLEVDLCSVNYLIILIAEAKHVGLSFFFFFFK